MKELLKYDIVHRDLKMANIFVDQDRVLIGDFGMAKIGNKVIGKRLGTPLNMAPEIIRGDDDISKSDIWSLGVLLY